MTAIVVAIVALQLLFHMKGEWARKLLPFPAMASVIFMLYATETRQAAILCAILLCLAVCCGLLQKSYPAVAGSLSPQ